MGGTYMLIQQNLSDKQKGLQTVKKTKFKKIIRNIKRARGLYLLLLIPLVYVFIFNYIPMYGIIIAFKRYSIRLGILGSEWVGLYHFKRFLGNIKFYEIMRNTVVLSVYSLVAVTQHNKAS